MWNCKDAILPRKVLQPKSPQTLLIYDKSFHFLNGKILASLSLFEIVFVFFAFLFVFLDKKKKKKYRDCISSIKNIF